MPALLQWLWPNVVDHGNAGRGVRQAYYAATILSVVFFFTAFLSIYAIQSGGADHRLDFVDAALFMVLGLCLKSRDPYAAVLALCICVLEAGYRWSLVMVPVWALLIVLFLNGVRGAYWLLRHPESPEPSEGADATATVSPQSAAPATKGGRPAFFGLSGRLDRRWYALYMVILVASSALGIALVSLVFSMWGINPQAQTLLTGLLCLFIILLAMMLTVRRCHDFDRSGWRALFLLLPGLGLLCFLAVPGSPANNSYGPSNS